MSAQGKGRKFRDADGKKGAPAAALTPEEFASLYPAYVERALQLLNKHIYQADRYTGMLIVLQADDAKEPVVISAGSYRRKRAPPD
ncbi:hypothetical protein R20233_03151 [Ralstonia sp. LMG 32965]|uniref:hypothetical protein n=1 Tax=Ralstonia flatus TaxID=3058601 RepID=UPI0028F5E43A|nr:hypothetical protein [Ralstonia sp. LMG 32965]CAJ0886413.1 hypothetical protein R20233_03151 [Ralstonia sp. LMG 32965]